MIYSIGLLLILGFIVGCLLDKIRIPGLVGMILIGFMFGPYCLNILDDSLIKISPYLRQIALIIILTRSGLNLDLPSLKKVGRSAILMCFIPATFEIIGVTIASYFFLHISIFEGLLLGSVLAAVSPAVVSPRMIKIIEEGYGENNQVPKMILAGSSCDDIFVIVLFYAFLGLNETGTFDAWSIAKIPISIVLGILLGVIVGFFLSFIFKKISLNVISKVVITLSISFLLVGLEEFLKKYVSISSLLSIIVFAMILLIKDEKGSKQLSSSYNSLWNVFEVLLFTLVGSSLNFNYLTKVGIMGLLTLLIGLVFRIIGVYVCLIGTKLTLKEKLFSMISYLPKATVQASIGGIALGVGLGVGELILVISILSILITAPIGAFLVDLSYKHLLNKEISVEYSD